MKIKKNQVKNFFWEIFIKLKINILGFLFNFVNMNYLLNSTRYANNVILYLLSLLLLLGKLKSFLISNIIQTFRKNSIIFINCTIFCKT